jgi:hypothetical protein
MYATLPYLTTASFDIGRPSPTSQKHIVHKNSLLFMFSFLLCVMQLRTTLIQHKEKKDDLHIVSCNRSICKNNFNNVALRLLNHLPRHITEIPKRYKFKNALKTYLLDHCFYMVKWMSFSRMGHTQALINCNHIIHEQIAFGIPTAQFSFLFFQQPKQHSRKWTCVGYSGEITDARKLHQEGRIDVVRCYSIVSYSETLYQCYHLHY